jgi:hypothetical protein
VVLCYTYPRFIFFFMIKFQIYFYLTVVLAGVLGLLAIAAPLIIMMLWRTLHLQVQYAHLLYCTEVHTLQNNIIKENSIAIHWLLQSIANL